MAEGRMLKKEISDSKKLGRLKSDRPRVLYFMMLPHLDREGRLKADPKKIKGQICTMLPYSLKSIQSALEQLHDVGLITLYNVNKEQCVQYTRFHDFQSFNPNREAESKILAPNPEESRVIQRTPLNVREVNVREENVMKRKFIPPTIEEIIEYVKSKKYNVDVKKFFEYYTESNWHDKDGKPVRNWKQKIIAVWDKPGGPKKCRFSYCREYGVYTTTDDTGQICWWCEKHKPALIQSLPKELTDNALQKVPDKDNRSISDKRNEQLKKLSMK